MAISVGIVGALSAFYHDSLDIYNQEHRELAAFRLIAKMPTIAAWSYKNEMGHPLNYPSNKLDYCSNFLYMMFALRTDEYEVDPVVADALDKLLILHADHEQNCSAATVRVIGSSQASLYASIAGGIAPNHVEAKQGYIGNRHGHHSSIGRCRQVDRCRR